MNLNEKGKSPFYPNQPVPIELFTGRSEEIQRILIRGAGQVAAGKMIPFFVRGEYGIGKSSIASFTQWLAEKNHHLFPIYVPLGGAKTLPDVGEAVVRSTIHESAYDQKKADRIRNFLAKYIGDQTLFGFTIRLEALKTDAPSIANGFLPFLHELLEKTKDDGYKGIFLVFDELNGISGNPDFAFFMKSLVDENALSKQPLPLLLMLCGTEERRREMIRNHQPIDRLFEIIDIKPLENVEVKDFFEKAFDSVQTVVENPALETMVYYSAGFPKIMHMIGDAAFWIDSDSKISEEDAVNAVVLAAEEMGKKFLHEQVYNVLRSSDYKSILDKIAALGPDIRFSRKQIAGNLSPSESKKLDNFLQKMLKLNVIKRGGIQGEYEITMRIVKLYIWLQSTIKKKHFEERQNNKIPMQE